MRQIPGQRARCRTFHCGDAGRGERRNPPGRLRRGLRGIGRLARRVQGRLVPEAELQAAFSRLSAVNMASMGGAMLGLAMVLAGLIL